MSRGDDPAGRLARPRRGADVPVGDGEDHDARALLASGGHPTAGPDAAAALDAATPIVRAAAARVLGADGVAEAAPALRRLAGDDPHEAVRVQAAYALGRLGEDGAGPRLAALAALDPEAGPAAVQAAGALARLGDPAAWPTVRAAVDSDNRVTAMAAVKQLHAFLPHADHADGLFRAYERALDGDPDLAAEARAHLEGTDDPRARALLDR